MHPEFVNNQFYVSGDSYSGITVPIITQVISDGKCLELNFLFIMSYACTHNVI